MMMLGRWLVAGLAVAAVLMGCARAVDFSETDIDDATSSGSGGTASGGAGGDGGQGGMATPLPCGVDCSVIDTPSCFKSVCNETTKTCEVVADDDGTSCDDGLFCTVDDTCKDGMCVGGGQNDCSLMPADCEDVTCDEASKSCGTTPKTQGAACIVQGDLCKVNATCQNGLCIGSDKDCFFAPVPNKCYTAICNSQNGMCEPQPDAMKDGDPCVDPMDLCTENKTCSAGMCKGGTAKDCSSLTVGCFNGVCDTMTGLCKQDPVPPGGQCAEAADDCNVGICDNMGKCNPQPANENGMCNTDGCFTGQTCVGGVCQGGVQITQCINADNCCPQGCTPANDDDCGCRIPTDYATVQLAADNLCDKIIIESNAPLSFTLVNPPQTVEIKPDTLNPPTLDGVNITVNQASVVARTILLHKFTFAGPTNHQLTLKNNDSNTTIDIAEINISNETTTNGQIYTTTSQNIIVRDSLFEGNSDQGGSNGSAVLYFNNVQNFKILRNVFKNNKTVGNFDNGGCMYLESSLSTGTIANNLFDGNSGNGTTWVAGGIFFEAPVANIEVINNTFVNNTNNIDLHASGIRCQSSCTGCVFKNNVSWNVAGNQYAGCAAATFSYNNFRNLAPPGVGNISVDPLLDANYKLMMGSPSINTGDPAVQYNDKDNSQNDMGWTGGPLAP